MRARVYFTAILVSLALQTSLQAQECDSHRAPLHLLWPYTAEYRGKNEYTDNQRRPIPTHELISVVARDSQGRRMDRGTDSNGESHFSVLDPVAAEKIVWNTRSTKAKVVQYSTPVADRRSCWQGPESERLFTFNPGEPLVGWTKLSCAPFGAPQTSCRDVCAADRLAKALPPEKSGFPPCDREELRRILESGRFRE